jgi:ABC-2 type transport system permease protein
MSGASASDEIAALSRRDPAASPPSRDPALRAHRGRVVTDALLGTGQLVKLALRRDRIMIPVWVYALAATAASTAYSFSHLYDTPQSRLDFAAGIARNPSTLAMYGPIHDPSTVGGLTAWRLVAIGATLVGVMSVLVVMRHTRADEEAGRLELISAGVVGRHAALSAGVLVAAIASVAVGLGAMIGLIAAGMPAVGSLAFGLAWCTAGLFFAAAAAVAAQLSESARTANGIGIGVVALAYLIRASADLGPAWLSWASPIGWAQQLRPFAGERWWVVAVALGASALVLWGAFELAGRRDLGAGLLPPRPGPARGELRGPVALAWRMHRGTLLAWTAGFALYGVAIGGVADGVTAIVGTSERTRRILTEMGGEKGVVDAFLATAMGILGLVVAGYAIQAVLRLRVEETALRAEPVLATPVGRIRWACSHVLFAVAGSIVILAAAGVGAGLAHGLRSHDVGGQLPRVLGAALVQVPATWVVTGAALLLFGLTPRFTAAAWGVLAGCLLLGQLGPVLRLPQWALDLSPFTHVPKLPGSALSAAALVGLTLVAALAAAAGLAGFRHRDIG